MKYTNEEIIGEDLKRSDKVRDERNRRSTRYLATASAVLFAALIAVIAFAPSGMSGTYAGGTVYGSLLLGREAGGYVLAAVIAFVLGVTVTILCLKHRSNGFFKKDEKEAT